MLNLRGDILQSQVCQLVSNLNGEIQYTCSNLIQQTHIIFRTHIFDIFKSSNQDFCYNMLLNITQHLITVPHQITTDCKILLVGDQISEKNQIAYYACNLNPPMHSEQENGISSVKFTVSNNERVLNLQITTLSSGDNYQRIREIMYADVDLIIFCFSLLSTNSLENILNKWYIEAGQYCQKRILVGNHSVDVQNQIIIDDLFAKHEEPVAATQISEVEEAIGALESFKIQANCRVGLDELFDWCCTKM